MATVNTLIKRALRLIRVIGAEESVKASDSETAITVLNEMVARFEEDGIALGWSGVSGVGDTVPAPESALNPLAYNLALELAPEYGAEPSDLLVRGAMDGMAALRRDSIKHSIEPVDFAHLPGEGSAFDINSGN